MRKITQLEFQEFEKDLLFKQIAYPDYRYGQAFLNYFKWVEDSLDADGDLGRIQANKIWNCSNREMVLNMCNSYTWLIGIYNND